MSNYKASSALQKEIVKDIMAKAAEGFVAVGEYGSRRQKAAVTFAKNNNGFSVEIAPRDFAAQVEGLPLKGESDYVLVWNELDYKNAINSQRKSITKERRPVGRPRKGKEPTVPVTIRLEPSAQAELIEKYGSVQAFADKAVEVFLALLEGGRK